MFLTRKRRKISTNCEIRLAKFQRKRVFICLFVFFFILLTIFYSQTPAKRLKL